MPWLHSPYPLPMIPRRNSTHHRLYQWSHAVTPLTIPSTYDPTLLHNRVLLFSNQNSFVAMFSVNNHSTRLHTACRIRILFHEHWSVETRTIVLFASVIINGRGNRDRTHTHTHTHTHTRTHKESQNLFSFEFERYSIVWPKGAT